MKAEFLAGRCNPVRLHLGLGYRPPVTYPPVTYEANMQAVMPKTCP